MSSESAESQPYTWSNVRIAEQVTINMLTALCLGFLTWILALTALGYQAVFNHVLIPTPTLVTICVLGGALFTLLLLAAIVYGLVIRFLQKYPMIGIFALLGAALGAQFEMSKMRHPAKNDAVPPQDNMSA